MDPASRKRRASDADSDPFHRQLSLAGLANCDKGFVYGRIFSTNPRWFNMRSTFGESNHTVSLSLRGEWATEVSFELEQDVCISTKDARVESHSDLTTVLEFTNFFHFKVRTDEGIWREEKFGELNKKKRQKKRRKNAADGKEKPHMTKLGPEVRLETANVDSDGGPEDESKLHVVESTPSEPGYDLRRLCGLKAQHVDFIPLAEARPSNKVSFIGVVTYVRGLERPKGGNAKWSQVINVVDATNLDRFGSHCWKDERPLGVQSVWFSKLHKGWLPSPSVGQILIGYMVKATVFNGADKLQLIGYADEYRWAIFDPSTKTFVYGDKDGVPDSDVLDNGYGPEYSPFLELAPDSLEYAYCLELSAWWNHKLALHAEFTKNQVHLDSVPTAQPPARTGREHCLLGEVTAPAWIDCTVEVIYTSPSSQSPSKYHYIFVTDYTGQPSLPPVTDSRCPPRLSKKVLPIEMWESEAVALGRQMQPGDIYRLGNTRVKFGNGSGFLEGVFKEVKHAKKLEDFDLLDNQHLKDLIARREEFQDSNVSPNKFEHQLIEDGQEFVPFDCTVEVLHADYCENGISKVYVTDYSNPDNLVPPMPSWKWKPSLNGRILRVELHDGQICMAQSMKADMFFRFQNLTLKRRKNALYGYLGGTDQLITKMNAVNSSDPHLKALKKRKAQDESLETETRTQATKSSDAKRKSLTPIRKIKFGSKFEGQAFVKARIVNFSPRDLGKAIQVTCQICCSGTDLSVDLDCDCGPRARAYHYELYFTLKDESSEDTLDVNVDESFSSLKDLRPAQLADLGYEDAQLQLKRQLARYIQHVPEDEEDRDALNGPLLELTIASTMPPSSGCDLSHGRYRLC